MPRYRRFFSASKVLGLDRDIVGVGVARSPSASWLFSTKYRQAPFALCLAVPKGTRNVTPWCALVRAIIPSGKITTFAHGERLFLYLVAPVPQMRQAAAGWSRSVTQATVGSARGATTGSPVGTPVQRAA
jgi:hypothetical protein